MVAVVDQSPLNEVAEAPYVKLLSPESKMPRLRDLRRRLYASDSIVRWCAQSLELDPSMRRRLIAIAGRMMVEIDLLTAEIISLGGDDGDGE